MQEIKIYNYQVECPDQLAIELIANKQDGYKVNWFNFNTGDTYYNSNGEEYIIENIDHENKIVIIKPITC